MVTKLMQMLWEEGEFILDAISDHPGIIFVTFLFAFFLFLLQKVATFEIFFYQPKKSDFQVNISFHFHVGEMEVNLSVEENVEVEQKTNLYFAIQSKCARQTKLIQTTYKYITIQSK